MDLIFRFVISIIDCKYFSLHKHILVKNISDFCLGLGIREYIFSRKSRKYVNKFILYKCLAKTYLCTLLTCIPYKKFIFSSQLHEVWYVCVNLGIFCTSIDVPPQYIL